MRIFRHLLAALSFLTRIPVPRGVQLDEAALAKSPVMFPVVGLLIGLIVAGFDRLARLALHPLVVGVADVALAFVLTAGLHLDGLMDTADGLLSGKPREKAMEIMKDSRVGAMGVSAGVLLVALKIATVAALPDGRRFAALIAAPVVARYLMFVAMTAFPYARMGTGLGSPFMREERPKETVISELAVSGLLVTAPIYGVARTPGLVAFAVSSLSVLVLGRSVKAYLGGLTGDVYGALCELAEACMYVILSARW